MLNNYDKFYTHKEEINSSVWLSENRKSESLIFADEVSALRLYSFGNLDKVENTILSGVIIKDSCVYLRYANAIQSINFKRFNGKLPYFNYPANYLDQNKNLIYNNIDSKIYR